MESHENLLDNGWHFMSAATHEGAVDAAHKLAAKGVHGFVRGNVIYSKTSFPAMKKLLGSWGPGDDLLYNE